MSVFICAFTSQTDCCMICFSSFRGCQNKIECKRHISCNFIRLFGLCILRIIRCILSRRNNRRIPAGESIGIRIITGFCGGPVRINRHSIFLNFCLGQFRTVIIQPGNIIISSIGILIRRSQPVVQADFMFTIPSERLRINIINVDLVFKSLAVIMAHIGDRIIFTGSVVRE